MKIALQILLLLGPVTVLIGYYAEPAPSAFGHHPLPPKASLRVKYERLLAQRKPQVVVIGTSIVQDNVDDRILTDELRVPAVTVAQAGVGPAWLYLALKNVVLRADPAPRVVAIAYRADNILRPGYRVSGLRRKFIEDLALDAEPDVVRLAYPRQGAALDGWHQQHPPQQGAALDGWLQQHSRLFRERESWRDHWHRQLQSIATGRSGAEIARSGRRVFADEERDATLVSQQAAQQDIDPEELARWNESRKLPFDTRVERSFVPLMIEQARRRGVTLVFVRMRQQRHALGKPDNARFAAAFARYLEARGAGHVSLVQAKSIRAEYFTVHDHVSKGRGVTAYTVALARVLRPVVERSD